MPGSLARARSRQKKVTRWLLSKYPMGANGCGRPVVQFGASSPLRCQQWGFLTDQDSGKGRGPVTDSRPDRRRSAAAAADAPVAALLHRTRCASESPRVGITNRVWCRCRRSQVPQGCVWSGRRAEMKREAKTPAREKCPDQFARSKKRNNRRQLVIRKAEQAIGLKRRKIVTHLEAVALTDRRACCSSRA